MTAAYPPEEPSVRISLAKIYNLLLQVQAAVANLTQQRAGDVEDLQRLETHVVKKLEDHEIRMRNMEERRWPIGQMMAVTAAGTFILGIFGALITVMAKIL